MSRRILRNVVLVFAAALLLVCGTAFWLVATENGTRWLIVRVQPLLPAGLSIGEVGGTLLDGVTLSNAGWTDDALRVRVGRLATTVELLPVMRREVRILTLEIQDVEVLATEAAPRSDTNEPWSLELPVTVILEEATVEDIRFSSDDARLDIDRVELAGQLAGSDLQIERLVVDSDVVTLNANASARLADRYAAAANVTWNLRLPGQPAMAGQLRLRGDAANYRVTHELTLPYAVLSEGQLAPVDGGLTFDLTNRWRSIDIAAGDNRNINLGDGNLHVIGNLAEFSYEIRTNVLTRDAPPLLVTSVGRRLANSIKIEVLSAWSERGRVSASGDVLTSAGSPWQMAFEISDLDAALVDARLRGSIDARGTSDGRIHDDGPVFDVAISELAGALNGYPIAGAAELAYANDTLEITNATIGVGDNVVRFSSSIGEELRVDASLDLPRLAQLGLDMSGNMSGDINAATDYDTLDINGTVRGANLAWRDYSVAQLNAEFAIPRSGRGTANLRLATAGIGNTVIDTVDLDVSGTTLAHEVRVSMATPDIRADAAVDASFAAERWSGQFSALTVIGDLLGEWQLQESTGFTVARKDFRLDKTCLTAGADKGYSCLAIASADSGVVDFDLTVNDLPLAALPVAWPEGATVAGFVEGSANGSLANGRLSGDVSLQLRDSSFRTVFEDEEITATLTRALATATVDNNRLDGRFEIQLENGADKLLGNLVVADLFDRQSAIGGKASIELNDLGLVGFFFPSITNPTGRIAGTIDIAGSLAAPDIVGEIGLSDGAFGVARAGVTITDVAMVIRQTEVGRLALRGSVRSGDGSLAITGETSLTENTGIRTELRLRGEDFELLKLPDWQVTASPDIVVVLDEREARVRGDLVIPAANVTFRELPTTVMKPSPDVVIHRGDEAAAARRFIVNLDVRTSLGDAVFLSGFGLTTGLEGAVRISGRSDTTYTSTGRLLLREGRYSAYGQELTIDDGELIFNGPLSNPTLNVRASRSASDGTVAGIHLTGTPQQPRSEVYSEPALSDVEALSYLLTGRPLSSASGEEGDILNQAAFALGLTSAGSVVSRVRNELGLESLGVQGTADDRQFFAGKRFGDRLLVEYAYGIVDNLGTLLLRYQLNSRLVVESRSGTVRTLDVVYSVKKP